VRRSGAVAGIALAATALLVGCSSGSDGSGAGDGSSGDSSSEASDTPPLETTSTLGKVTGRLAKAERSEVRRDVTEVVDEWIDAAYVAGDYPRSDFAGAWAGFTKVAATQAKDDRTLLSNADIGPDIDGVEATKRDVVVDVLAVKGQPQGATARVTLKFKTSGDVQRKVVVRGRLYLMPGPEGWQVFGYDVTKGRGA